MYIQECDRHRVDGEVPLGRYPVKQKLSATFIVTHLVTRKTLVKQKNIHTIWILVKDSWKPRLFISSSRSVSLIIAFGVVPLSLLCTERKNSMTDSPSISNSKTYIKPLCKTETSPGSEFTQNVWVFSFYIADFLSHLGKWIKLIKIEAEYEHFKKVEITQNTTSSPSFCNVYVIK